MDEHYLQFAAHIKEANYIVVLTGSGISVNAGFQTFVNEACVYDKAAKSIFDRFALGKYTWKLYKQAAKLIQIKRSAPGIHDSFNPYFNLYFSNLYTRFFQVLDV